MMTYGKSPQRVGKSNGKGLVGRTMGNKPIPKDPNRVSVKSYTRTKVKGR